MLKNILIKTAELVNRDDIIHTLKKVTSIEEITNETVMTDILKMISYCNYTFNDLFENYIYLNKNEEVISDENNRIYYSNLSSIPTKILSVKTSSNLNTLFSVNSTFISTNAPNQSFIINYNYIPNEIKNFNDTIELPLSLNIKIVCYGIASEFMASKDQYDKSNFWKNRYLYEIFKLKIKKERRIKSTFNKWN